MTERGGLPHRILAGSAVALALAALSVGLVGAVGGASAPSAVTGHVAAEQVVDGQVTDGQVENGSEEAAAVAEPETDNTVTRIEVREDGSARWHVRVRTRLETEEDVTTFEAYQERLRENRTAAVASFEAQMKRVVAAAENVTGRPMTATNFSVSTTVRPVPRRWGIDTTSFTWEGFARTDGQRLEVGDAFEDGYFIQRNETLQLRAPDGYTFASVSPPPDESTNGTAVWVGRVDFGAGEPAATIAPATGQSGDESADGLDAGLLGLALLAAVVAVAIPAVWYRRRSAGPDRTGREPVAADGSASSGVAADGTQAPAPEPITDAERVRRLVRDRGGRMKQADIVDEVDWSKSKVSRVLGDLADDGVVEKTRIGRENVVSLVEDGTDGSTDD